jgi:hypothetical protein
LRKGLLRAAEVALKLRFGKQGLAVLPRVRAITDPALLDRLVAAISQGRTLEKVVSLLERPEPKATDGRDERRPTRRRRPVP